MRRKRRVALITGADRGIGFATAQAFAHSTSTDDPNRQAYRSEFSTNGRNFYFTIGKDEADIWVMELQKK